MGYERRSTQTSQQPQAAPAPRANAALAKVDAAQMVGAYRDPREINSALSNVAEQCHLLTPATNIGTLPEGCEIVLTAVMVDPDRDCYLPKNSGGDFALKKNKLDEIGKALGVSWLPRECYRVDDGSSPYYCHYRVAGEYRAFDGQKVVITGEKQMDLRTGSAMQLAMKENELAMARSHILSHAESKAKNRAIRSTGLRHAYSRAELAKPFICARIMFTGRTDDVELRRQFATDISRSFTDSSATLYGNPEPRLPTTVKAGSPPPPVGATPVDDEGVIPAHGEASCGAPAAAPGGGKAANDGKPKLSGHTIAVGGRELPIEQAPKTLLQDAIQQTGEDLANGVVPPDDVVAARTWRNALIAQVAKMEERY